MVRYRAIHTILLLQLAAASPLLAQGARIVASPEAAPALRGRLLREAVDPCLGLHWQWIADPLHPERPYRLVMAGAEIVPGIPASTAANAQAPANLSAPTASVSASVSAPVIRAGDAITVHQETGAVRARLQAIALDSARAGEPLRVRLTVTSDAGQGRNFVLSSLGPVVTVRAAAAHEAVWSSTAASSSTQALPREQRQ